MNVARKMTSIMVGCFACIGGHAQSVDCNSAATIQKLVCVVPYRTGAGASNQTEQANIFSGPIGAQISQLPLAASAPGALTLTIHGDPDPYRNLGPVLVDRPDSVGQGHLVLGFSAEQFNFNHLDGMGIGSIPFVYNVTAPGTATTQSFFQQNIHASLKYNQYVMLATYGFPKKTDVTVIVPYTRISIGVAALSPLQYTPSGATYITSPPQVSAGYTPGTARGLGDIIINGKHVLWSGGDAQLTSVAAGFAARLPTGDALNYLGSGAYGFNLFGLAAYKARISPHVKIGYQWNTNSVLLNISGLGANQKLPGGLQTALGADYRVLSKSVLRSLTISADMLTNQFQNSPYIAQMTYAETANGANALNGFNPSVQAKVGGLSTVSKVNRTVTTINLSGGVKYKPFARHDVILYANVLYQANDVGLRSDPSPSGGISYNFRADKLPKFLYRSPGHW